MDTDFTNDNDVRAVLIVHDTKPPFLDGRVSFTKQSQAVMPIRDPTSDMAVIARNGSHLVKEVREKKEKNKSRARFWEMAGSKIGQITGAPPYSCPLSLPQAQAPLHGQRPGYVALHDPTADLQPPVPATGWLRLNCAALHDPVAALQG